MHSFCGGGRQPVGSQRPRELNPADAEDPEMSETTPQAPAKSEQKVPASAPVGRLEGVWQPLGALREEMDRVFDNFLRGFGFGAGRLPRRTGTEPQPFWRFETGFGVGVPAMDGG